MLLVVLSFGSFVILDVVCRFLSLFLLYIIKEKWVKIVHVRLAGDHLFTWMSLVMYLMVSFCAVLFSNEMSWMRSGT